MVTTYYLPLSMKPATRKPQQLVTLTHCAPITGSRSQKARTLTEVQQRLQLSFSKCSQHLGMPGPGPSRPTLYQQEFCTHRGYKSIISPPGHHTSCISDLPQPQRCLIKNSQLHPSFPYIKRWFPWIKLSGFRLFMTLIGRVKIL